MAQSSVLDTKGNSRLQAELAAALERADRAEVQLRTAIEESLRLSDRVELLEHELADAKRELAKCREETVAMTALAATHGTRAVELDREALALREKSYQLELDVSAIVAERDRFRSEAAGAQVTIDDMVAARNQFVKQLEDAAKQLARSSAAAAAAEDRHKAEMQQLQLRLAALEAEFRALHHGKGTMQEDLQRARGELMVLQTQLTDESRQKEEQASECRRLQRELEMALEALAQAQRTQRSAAAKADELKEELQRLRAAYSAMEADMQGAAERIERLQDEARVAAERNTEMAGQVQSLTASLRHLEVENARLTDGHAMLRVEVEARAAEARSARGEAAELAADRARLLAEMQQQKPAGGDDELGRLRDALTASRLEVARLQKELVANDAVLADAESALVALVSEKESLQRALSVVTQSDVAALAARPPPAQGAVVRASPQRTQALDGNRVDQERMMSYLQSLPDADAAAAPSDSGQDHSPATTPAVTSPRPGSNASSMMAAAAATTTVRVISPPGPVTSAPRYPVQHTLSTSESASTLPTYRPGGRMDSWEAISAAGTDNSRKESGSGEGAGGVHVVAGVPSATSLVAESLSFAMGSASTSHGALPLAPKAAEPPALTALMATGLGYAADLAPGSPAARGFMPPPSRRESSAALSGLPESGDISLAGMAHDYTADSAGPRAIRRSAMPASLGAVAGGLGLATSTAAGTLASRLSLLPPRSPHRATAERLERDGESLGPGDLGAQVQAQQPAAGHQPASALVGSSHTATARTPTLQSQPHVGGAAPPEFSITPHPDVYRGAPQPPFLNLAPYQSCPSTAAAPVSHSGASSPAGGYPAAANGGSSPVGASASQAGSASRAPDPTASPLTRHVVSADAVSALQSSSPYRSPTRVSLIAPRPTAAPSGTPTASDAEGAERLAASRQSSMGVINAASSSSPMISPRVMIEARMLSRAVRPSADALSNPVRASGVVPGGAAATGHVGAGAPHQAPPGDCVSGRAPAVPVPAGSLPQQPSRPQQQLVFHKPSVAIEAPPSPAYCKHMGAADAPLSPTYYKSNGVPDAPQPGAAAFPSPFASGNAAAAVASPRSSGVVGVLAPASSPPAPPPAMQPPMAAPLPPALATAAASSASPRGSSSIVIAPAPVLGLSVDPQSRHFSREPQPSSVSLYQHARPSFSYASRSILTAEAGLAGGEAASDSASGEEQLAPELNTPMDYAVPGTVAMESPTGATNVHPILLPPAPSEEDEALVKRLAAMDDALRVIGAI